MLRSVRTPNLLPYLEAVLQESMRCYPSIPATQPRITGPKGALIDGYFIPGNVCKILPLSLSNVNLHFQISVGVHQWSTYHSDANFACPDTSAPERWLPDSPLKYHHEDKAALQPFSLGPEVASERGQSLLILRIK